MSATNNNQVSECDNCGEVIVNTQPVYMYTQNWVHRRSGRAECHRASIAVPRREGDGE